MRLFEVARGSLAKGWFEMEMQRKARIQERAQELREIAQAKHEIAERDRAIARDRTIARNRRDRAIAQLLSLTTVREVNGVRHMVAKKGCLFAVVSLRNELEENAAAARPAGGYPAMQWLVRPEYPEGAARGPVPRDGMKSALMGERARLEKFMKSGCFNPTVYARLSDQLTRVTERLAFLYATEIVKRTKKHEYARQEFRTMPRNWVGLA